MSGKSIFLNWQKLGIIMSNLLLIRIILDYSILPSDIEATVGFASECPLIECVCTGYPSSGLFPQPEIYSCLLIPEMTTGEPYSLNFSS
jgi:hypothetical protein